MSRFRVVNSSPGVYWIEDSVGDTRWPNGMGLTFVQSDYAGVLNPTQALKQAEAVCEKLNALDSALHRPRVELAQNEVLEDWIFKQYIQIKFQSGPIKEHGVNGVQVEDLIQLGIDRLRFLNTKMACRENSISLTHLETALLWLLKRTTERQKQGVEGKHLPHVS